MYLTKPGPKYYANLSMSLWKVRKLSNESGKCLRSCAAYEFVNICLMLICSNMKDPLAVPIQSSTFQHGICRCIFCSIPDSLPSQANYLFRDRYNVWRRSRSLCSHPGCESINVTVDSDKRLIIVLSVSTCSFMPFLRCMLLEQSVGILCQ